MLIEFKNKCSENWDKMTPNSRGKYCSQCEKSVIDFTDKSALEIVNLMSKKKGNVCARMTSEQLKTIYPAPEVTAFKLPYSRTAASLMVAASIGVAVTSHASTNDVGDLIPNIETTSSSAEILSVKQAESHHINSDISNKWIKVRGIVTDKSKKPIQNAKVTFYGMSNFVSTYSKADGTFTLSVPEYLVKENNLISFTYDEVKEEVTEGAYFNGYESKDIVLVKNELKNYQSIQAEELHLYLGGIGYADAKDPLIIVNGEKVRYKEYRNYINNKNSTIDFASMVTKYVDSHLAVKYYGNRASGGLILFYNQIPE